MNHYDDTDIAIVGMAGRFPGAKNIDEFWRNLRDGVESIRFFTDEELKALGVDDSTLADPNYVKAVATLDDPEYFDATFFDMTPKEAEITDPQHRVLLECAWEALESAGYDPETFKAPAGVYAGATINTYLLLNILSNPDFLNTLDDAQINIGNGGDFITTRISYKLNLKGPSHVIQSACSTSLVAVHVACQSLLNEECDLALAGGVSINVKHRYGYHHAPGGITSLDGHCRAFDAKAQGTIFASGVGIVVLKRMQDALANRDFIHAVIKGSAINNDGSSKVGYTAPSVDGQAGVIAEALANAGVHPETIGYVEAHGTGTPLGDPIEIQSLTKAFRASTDLKRFCAIGSVKTNIGHLDAAAGVAGLIKTVLALKHKMIPPSLHFQQPNPKIDFQNSPFFVNSQLSKWDSPDTPRRAGVSAFGVGGTNAHVILEEAPSHVATTGSRPWQLLVLSAKNAASLEDATTKLKEYLQEGTEAELADIAYTLKVGRKEMSHRRVIVCEEKADAITAMGSMDAQRVYTGKQQASDRPVVFMFPGQGAQYVNMGLDLYQHEPVFRKEIDQSCELLKGRLGIDLRNLLYPANGDVESSARQLSQTRFTQPALFVIEYALARLWMSWGIRPQAMIGHSIGEYVAACLAGVFTLQDALALISERARMMQELPDGSMLAVPYAKEKLQPLLREKLSLAAINAPNQCVVSGPVRAIEELEKYLNENGSVGRRLQTSHAFHSEMIDLIIKRFADCVGQVELQPPSIPFISNLTGTWMTQEDAVDPDYWAKQMRNTVLFADGVQELLKQPARVFLEVGPGQALSKYVKRQPDGAPERLTIASLPSRNDKQSEMPLLLRQLGALWVAGVEVDWSGSYSDEKRRRLPLPTYSFERRRYWIEPAKSSRHGSRTEQGKKPEIAEWFYMPSWKRTLPPRLSETGKLKMARRVWLVFDNGSKLAISIIRRLEEEGLSAVVVKAGEQFARDNDWCFTINPTSPEAYAALARRLSNMGDAQIEVLHLWTLTPSANTLPTSDQSGESLDFGFYSLLFLIQALESQTLEAPVHITVISNQIATVTCSEPASPDKATLIGLCKVIPQEHRNFSCRVIDTGIPEADGWREKKLVELLLAEMAADCKEDMVAYRCGQRWAQITEPINVSNSAQEISPLRKNGVYLITGGLARTGLAVAEHLAEAAQARLVVIESAGIPARGEWSGWIASHSEQDVVSRRIRSAQRLEGFGAQLLFVNADVSVREQMKEAITQAVEQFGNIDGVIHSAAVDRKWLFRSLRDIDRIECDRYFRQTHDTLVAMEEALSDRELDFCILFSSLSSWLGGVGSVVHTSSNLYMETFARLHNQSDRMPWIIINWDAWLLKDEMEQVAAINADLARLAISFEEGIEVFRRILSHGLTDQVMISTADLSAELEQRLYSGQRPSPNQESIIRPEYLHPRPQIESNYVAASSELERSIASIWQGALGIEQVGIDDNFFELGGDSLIAIQVASQLKKELNIDVQVVSLYEQLTVRLLADLLTAEQNDAQVEQAVTHIAQREAKAHRRRDLQQKERARRRAPKG